MESFDSILASILKSIEDNPSSNVDEVIAAKMSELGLSEEGQTTLAETNACLEAYHEMYSNLQAAKAEGATRNQWVQEELLQIANKHNLSDEQAEQLVADVAKACEEGLKTTLTEGE